MQYREGNIGRVFYIKIENGENLVQCIKDVAVKEKIKTASFTLLGAVREAKCVAGPELPVIPPDVIWKSFSDGREVVGAGTLVIDEAGEPNLHIHLSAGREDSAFVGCFRDNGEVFIVIEAVVYEILGIDAVRALDENTGLKMLKFI